MARKEARVFTSIWRDKDFLALPPTPQRLYMFLLSQEDLTHCGVIPLRESRWAPKAAGLTIGDIEQDLKSLGAAGRQFVITDYETGELLIRSFIRHDEVWKQPNLMKAARSAAAQVESVAIRVALAEELRRIPAAGSSSKLVRDVHASFLNDLEKSLANPSANPSPESSANPGQDPEAIVPAGQDDAGNPSPNPSGDPTPEPSANPRPDPSGDPSANPSQEKGDGYGLSEGDLLPPEPLPSGGPKKTSRNPSAKASRNPSGEPPTDAHVGHVVAAYVDGAKAAGLKPPAMSLRARVGRQARELLIGPDWTAAQLIESAKRMGAGDWNDLAVQVRKDDAAANGRGGGKAGPKQVNYTDEEYASGW